MSHFLAYRGPEVTLSKLLHLPKSSLICETENDSKKSVLSDGFGVGWYNRKITPYPALFKTIRSPLNDDNLISLSETVQSNCLFMHQLTIEESYSAQQINCQPFRYGPIMFMHIGKLSAFHLIKKDMIKKITSTAFDVIKGHSVSEYIFAFYLSQLDLRKEKFSQKELENALTTTITKLTTMCRKIDRRYHLSLNIAVTDFDHFLALRFMDDFKLKAEPMYYAVGDSIDIDNGTLDIERKNPRHNFVMISSKKLSANEDDWIEIPENHLVSVSSLHNVSTKAII